MRAARLRKEISHRPLSPGHDFESVLSTFFTDNHVSGTSPIISGETGLATSEVGSTIDDIQVPFPLKIYA